jgi:peptidyl-Lys metalloendopeptidase
VVDFKIENLSKDLAFVLAYNTPLEKVILDDLFEVSIKGQRVDYLGVIARRAEPTFEDYVPIKPSQSISRTVDLAPLYDFSVQGEYTVQLNTLLYYFSNHSDEKVIELISNPVSMFSANWTAPVIPQLGDPASTYIGCSATQESQTRTAENTGHNWVNSATRYMQANSCTGTYVTWFGTVTSTRWQRVTSGFVATRTAFANSRFRMNCGGSSCQSNVYAYVFPSDSAQNIYLCALFFSTTAVDRAETIVHEASHFNSVMGTNDYAYGRSACQNLARNTPDNAVRNADNVCYFASANLNC